MITTQRLLLSDSSSIQQIANWYTQEWNIPSEKTIQQLSTLPDSGFPLQLMLYVNQELVATGGIYLHVGLLDREPRFKIYQPWLALVYTHPDFRGCGYGTLLCEMLEAEAKKEKCTELYLFTHTAESLYQRLRWNAFERLQLGDRNIVVMRKTL